MWRRTQLHERTRTLTRVNIAQLVAGLGLKHNFATAILFFKFSFNELTRMAQTLHNKTIFLHVIIIDIQNTQTLTHTSTSLSSSSSCWDKRLKVCTPGISDCENCNDLESFIELDLSYEHKNLKSDQLFPTSRWTPFIICRQKGTVWQ